MPKNGTFFPEKGPIFWQNPGYQGKFPATSGFLSYLTTNDGGGTDWATRDHRIFFVGIRKKDEWL